MKSILLKRPANIFYYSSFIKAIIFILFLSVDIATLQAQQNDEGEMSEEEAIRNEDSIKKIVHFPSADRMGDFFSTPTNNSFIEALDPPILQIKRDLIYKPKLQAFITQERIGDADIRHPFLFSKKEINNITSSKANESFFEKKSNVMLFLSQRGGIPRFSASNFIFNNVFGVHNIASSAKEIYDANKNKIKDFKKIPKATFNSITQTFSTVKNYANKADSVYNKIKKIDSAEIKKFAKKIATEAKTQLLEEVKKPVKEIKKSYKEIQDEIKNAEKAFDSAQLISINPKGFVDFIVGYENSETDNPSLPISYRSNSAPLIDLKFDGNLNSTIGTKLALPIGLSNLNNFDLRNPLYVVGGVSAAAAVASNASAISGSNNGVSLPTFNSSNIFQQGLKRVKINYKGDDDQIIKKVDVGTTSFETKSQIIRGAKELFGVNLQAQFGRLTLSSVVAYQTSKLKTITLADGSAAQNIRIKSSDYEDNKNFLLAHYFKNNFNSALKKTPLVQSNVQILRVEIWVSNRNAVSTDTREIIALSDLAESANDIANRNLVSSLASDGALPDNANNNLYQQLLANPGLRNSRNAVNALTQMGYVQGVDFEKVYSRKVAASSVFIHPTLGFIMLNENVGNEGIVGVSYEYQVNGKIYKVGEFSEEITLDQTGDYTKILFTKLLKPISPQPNLPIWKLTMRNVYTLGVNGIKKEGFNVNVLYDEPSKGEKIYLPYADPAYKKTIISLLNADRLNINNDFIADGIFDFIDNLTIFPDKGKLIFPVLEPFGKDLEYVFNNKSTAQKYLYYSLYDSIKSFASQQIEANRYIIKGSIKNSNTSQIFLGSYNMPPGSVKISQQGNVLKEGIDYNIDYNIGSLVIINKSISDSRLPLVVQLEDNSAIGFQQKTFLGLRADYLFNKNLSIGATYANLNELPFNYKITYGQEAINNQMFGFDVNYQTKSRAVSYFLDKLLPNFVTKEASKINVFAEIAKYSPNYNSLTQFVPEGSIYLDDFENSYSNISLSVAPIINWNLCATPKGATNDMGVILFPEANFNNQLDINKNRAHFAWYQIDANLQAPELSNNPARGTNLFDPRWRRIQTNEVFPSITTNFNNQYTTTFDIAYFPQEKGQYNFETSTSEINDNGLFLNPQNKFGGISFAFQDQSNFEDKNIEYIQFWMQDPFVNNPNTDGGDLYFNLGNVSEDVLNDNLRMYENGISTPSFLSAIDNTIWGKVPRNPTPVSTTFIGIANERILQDVGLDGIGDDEEKNIYKNYLGQLENNFGTKSSVYQKAFTDPSSDNFLSNREPDYDSKISLLQRYKYFNNMQGNSKIAENSNQVYAATSLPDKEDVNNDNVLNTNESYFQYVVHLKPNMPIGTNYIVDRRSVITKMQLYNQSTPSDQVVNWYLFRVPIRSYYGKVGNINDFKSIRFMRMFMHNFKDEAVLRMLKFGLVSNNWRKANFAIDQSGNNTPLNIDHNDNLFVSNINIEENDYRFPMPYSLPPGISRIQQNVDNSNIVYQNEQALSLRIKNLKQNEARGVFKNMALNLINYDKIKMFIHAETLYGDSKLNNDEIDAVVRIGTDYINNYYEIKIPLKITQEQAQYFETDIWPSENNLDIDLQTLTQIKSRRNKLRLNPYTPYSETINGKTITIMGNPTLADIKGVLVALNNKTNVTKSIEIWINELRLEGLNTKNAYAGIGKMDVQLADLGTMSLTGSFQNSGFGNLEQKTNERSRETSQQFTVSSNLDLSKFLPRTIKMNFPFYLNYSQALSTPEYDPLETDTKLDYKLSLLQTQKQKDSLTARSIDQTQTQTYSFTNVRVLPNKNEVPAFYSIKYWDFSYTYTAINKQSPIVEIYDFTNHNANANYSYSPSPFYFEPFQTLITSKSSLALLIKKINFNVIPSNIAFKILLDRNFVISKSRSIYEDDEFQLPEYYDKRFSILRTYSTKLNLTKSISIDYKANNFSRIDEAFGRLDNAEKTIEVWKQIFKGGRNVLFNHNINLAYTIPTQQLPMLNWTTLRLAYNVDFTWTSAPDSLFYLGHTINNMKKQEADLLLNFNALFNKFGFAQTKNTTEKNINTFSSNGERSFIKSIIFFLQSARFNIKETYQSTINGFLFTPQIFGNNISKLAPGLDVTLLGSQVSQSWLDEKAKQGWISSSTELNRNFLQTYSKVILAEVEIKPLPYLEIGLTFNYSFGKNYSELFKDTTGKGNFAHLSPFSTGKFEMSYWAFETSFDNYTSNGTTQSFQNFILLRKNLSQRLGKNNSLSTLETDGYYKGYNQFAQDVIIPSFIAAYTNKNVASIPLINNQHNRIEDNPFSGFFPLPSWKITYTGLGNISFLKKIFTAIKLNNGYTGNISSNDLSINPRYEELLIGIPVFLDPLSGNFIPYFRIPNITISEKFDPFIGIDIATINKTTIGLKYSKERTISMSIVDFQISENFKEQFGTSFSYRFKGFKNFNEVKKIKIKNEFVFKIDVLYTRDFNYNMKFNQDYKTPTGGNTLMNILPSLEFLTTSNLTFKLFYEYKLAKNNLTQISTINQRGGLLVRLSF